MSKIFDINKMYGQDFNITATNAYTNIINNNRLLPNTILISSPSNDDEYDDNMPALFATDFEGSPLQLTYPFMLGNGLSISESYNSNHYLYLNIDNKTIKSSNDNQLTIDTSYLSKANMNGQYGIVGLQDIDSKINRNLKTKISELSNSKFNLDYNSKTFISINSEGILYIDNSLLDLINLIVDTKVNQKFNAMKILMNSNLKMWLTVRYKNNEPSEKIYNFNSPESIKIDEDNDNQNGITTFVFDLEYFSYNSDPEEITIYDDTNKIYRIDYNGDNGKLTTVTYIEDNLYQHKLSNVFVAFLPNYFIRNNNSYAIEIPLSVKANNNPSASTIICKQNKIEGFDNKFGIQLYSSIDNETGNLNYIISISNVMQNAETSIINGIIHNEIFKNLTFLDSGENIINYSYSVYFINNSNPNKNYLIYESSYNPNDSNENYEFNFEINGTGNSPLYAFIYNIVEENESQDYYSINLKTTINKNNDVVNPNDFIIQNVKEGVINYDIKVGLDFKISVNNNEIGTYTINNTFTLDLSCNANYGFMKILSSSKPNEVLNKSMIYGVGSSNTDIRYNIPNQIYYNQRSNESRLLISNVIDYNGKDINTSKLYCIFDTDLIFDDETGSNAYFRIYFDRFNIYSKETEKDDSFDINNVEIDNELCTLNDNYLELKLGNNADECSHNLYKLLGSGMDIKLTFHKDYDIKNTIGSQIIQLNVNILEILMNNISIKEVDNSEARGKYIRGTEFINNISNVNSSLYYGMNNYIVTKAINNNKIEKIFFNIPNYVLFILSKQNVQLTTTIGVYYQSLDINNNVIPDVKDIKIITQRINNTISSSIIADTNIYDSNNKPLLKLDHTVFDINIDGTDSYFELYADEDLVTIPKLLYIKFNFSFADSNDYKICYFEDTRNCQGGDIKYEKVGTSALYINEDNKEPIYDVVSITSYSTPYLKPSTGDYVPEYLYNNEYKSNLINQTINGENTTTTGIIVENLRIGSSKKYVYDEGLNFTDPDSPNNSNDNLFQLLTTKPNHDSGDLVDISYYHNENSSILTNVDKHSELAPIYFNFKYLPNPNHKLDEYNSYVDEDSQFGSKKSEIVTVNSDYYLRFTNVNITFKEPNSNGIYYKQYDKFIKLYNFTTDNIYNILKRQFNISINGLCDNKYYSNLRLVDPSDSTYTKVESSSINYNVIYKLMIDVTLYEDGGKPLHMINLDLGYTIKYAHIATSNWRGLYNQKTGYGFTGSGIDINITGPTYSQKFDNEILHAVTNGLQAYGLKIDNQSDIEISLSVGDPVYGGTGAVNTLMVNGTSISNYIYNIEKPGYNKYGGGGGSIYINTLKFDDIEINNFNPGWYLGINYISPPKEMIPDEWLKFNSELPTITSSSDVDIPGMITYNTEIPYIYGNAVSKLNIAKFEGEALKLEINTIANEIINIKNPSLTAGAPIYGDSGSELDSSQISIDRSKGVYRIPEVVTVTVSAPTDRTGGGMSPIIDNGISGDDLDFFMARFNTKVISCTIPVIIEVNIEAKPVTEQGSWSAGSGSQSSSSNQQHANDDLPLTPSGPGNSSMILGVGEGETPSSVDFTITNNDTSTFELYYQWPTGDNDLSAKGISLEFTSSAPNIVNVDGKGLASASPLSYDATVKVTLAAVWKGNEEWLPFTISTTFTVKYVTETPLYGTHEPEFGWDLSSGTGGEESSNSPVFGDGDSNQNQEDFEPPIDGFSGIVMADNQIHPNYNHIPQFSINTNVPPVAPIEFTSSVPNIVGVDGSGNISICPLNYPAEISATVSAAFAGNSYYSPKTTQCQVDVKYVFTKEEPENPIKQVSIVVGYDSINNTYTFLGDNNGTVMGLPVDVAAFSYGNTGGPILTNSHITNSSIDVNVIDNGSSELDTRTFSITLDQVSNDIGFKLYPNTINYIYIKKGNNDTIKWGTNWNGNVNNDNEYYTFESFGLIIESPSQPIECYSSNPNIISVINKIDMSTESIIFATLNPNLANGMYQGHYKVIINFASAKQGWSINQIKHTDTNNGSTSNSFIEFDVIIDNV